MIRVGIVDDHEIVREGVRLILEGAEDVQVVGQACDGAEALRLAGEASPDILLMDLVMPGMDGIEACRRLAREHPAVKVLVLSQVDSEAHLLKVLEAGALGYVLKQSAREELLWAVRTVAAGHVYLTPPMASLLVRQTLRRPSPGPAARLTAREQAVLKLIARGLTNQEIARSLGLSIKTVQTHRGNIMEKLDLHDRVALVRYALKEGLATLEETGELPREEP
ncbi:MAG TPA: response regulator transcription factor [Candidatus Nitrosotenuis sp.]|jgi:two-component system response regulator NreC|nr:response regulator transcription factor [Candidatus Nitrosotenuis sp.]